jgi:hypothetical protein
MFAAKLAGIPGISPSTAKAILVLGLGAISAGLMALVQDGTLAGPIATLAPVISGFLTGLAALVDPNASHDPSAGA